MNRLNHAQDTLPHPKKPLWQRVVELERDNATLQARHTTLRQQIQQLEQMIQQRTLFGECLLNTESTTQE